MNFQKILVLGLALFFPTVIVIFIIVFNVITFRHWSQVQQLNQSGITTQATIINKDQTLGLKAPNTFYVTYRYQAQNSQGSSQEYIIKKKVDENTYSLLTINSQVKILYILTNPNISDIKGNQALDRMIIVCLGIDVVFIIFLIMIVFHYIY